ncbi:unnamed protein product [Ectocarpus sp. 4 AP-2014]
MSSNLVVLFLAAPPAQWASRHITSRNLVTLFDVRFSSAWERGKGIKNSSSRRWRGRTNKGTMRDGKGENEFRVVVGGQKLEEISHKDGKTYIQMMLFSKVSYGVEYTEEVKGLGAVERNTQKWPVSPYTVAVRNNSGKGNFAQLYVDGQKVAEKYVPAGDSVIFEGIPTEEGIQELLFSLPRYTTLREKEIGGQSLPDAVASELGTVKFRGQLPDVRGGELLQAGQQDRRQTHWRCRGGSRGGREVRIYHKGGQGDRDERGQILCREQVPVRRGAVVGDPSVPHQRLPREDRCDTEGYEPGGSRGAEEEETRTAQEAQAAGRGGGGGSLRSPASPGVSGGRAASGSRRGRRGRGLKSEPGDRPEDERAWLLGWRLDRDRLMSSSSCGRDRREELWNQDC